MSTKKKAQEVTQTKGKSKQPNMIKIGGFPDGKSGKTRIRVAINTWPNGNRYVDIRKWYRDEEDKFQPGRNGISFDIGKTDDGEISLDTLRKAIKLLIKARKYLEENPE